MKRFVILFFILIPLVMSAQKKRGSDLIDSLLQVLEQEKDLKSKAILNGNIGAVQSEIREFSKAIEYDTKALRLFEKLGDKNSMARLEGNIGSVYLGAALDTSDAENMSADAKKSNLRNAIAHLSRSNEISKDNGYLDLIDTFYKDQQKALMVLNYDEAMVNSAKKKPGQSSNTQSTLKIANYDANREKVEAEVKEKIRWYYFVGIAVLVVVFVGMVMIYRRQKAESKIVAEEKKKSEDLILNILPEQVARELKEKGMIHAQQYDDVTVIITDFVSFTTVAERFSPKQLVGELHACFKAFDGMLDKYKIEKIKTVGDAYLAVAGVPVANANHAADAISVAIMMRDFMNYRKNQLGDATFEMRIGVHSGSVVAGIVGVKKFAYDIWGDTVNLAARMEQNCEPGKINISQSTYDLVKDKFQCDYRGEIVAKNKGKLKMYFVNEKIRLVPGDSHDITSGLSDAPSAQKQVK